MSSDESPAFDWADVDVIVAHQLPIGIYQNLAGDIVIRQRSDDYYDDDHIIWFSPEHARAVAVGILREAGIDITALAPKSVQVGSKPKDSTGAERQRRYRESKKKEATPEPDIFDSDGRDVTDHNDRNGAGDGQAA